MADCTIIPVILIDGLKFLLYKHTTNTSEANCCILEVNDVCVGSIPGGFLRGTFKGGDQTDFLNNNVWVNWGGMLE